MKFPSPERDELAIARHASLSLSLFLSIWLSLSPPALQKFEIALLMTTFQWG